jgi:hypothetical protein
LITPFSLSPFLHFFLSVFTDVITSHIFLL